MRETEWKNEKKVVQVKEKRDMGGKRSRGIFRKSVGVKKKVEKGVKRYIERKKIKKEQGLERKIKMRHNNWWERQKSQGAARKTNKR